ncbi:Alanine aminotransferase 2 [Nymphon striatum]|nr:Alanine aminotransferase 2 [Nymphon striatum]
MFVQQVIRQARPSIISHLPKSLHSSSPSLEAMESSSHKTLTVDNLNPNLIKMEYAVRGPLVIRATAIEKELQQGVKKPFKEVTKANIGDCHAVGQKPLTFMRQVLALCTYPELQALDMFPSDAKKKAEELLSGCKGRSIGSYSDSVGVEIIRKHVAEYIERRDKIPADINNIFLCTGASDGIRGILKCLNHTENGKPPGVMIPIPQYPLYSATLAEFGMQQINYYLDEDNNWALDIRELKRSIEEAKQFCKPRALCVINPGNPTGSVLTPDNIREIIKFSHDNNLFLLADEVYQDNVYAEGMQFHSFKKLMMEMGPPYSNMELASFMSTSKGYMGECGLRGGFCEFVNLDPQVTALFLKSISAKLCPTVLGQVAMDVVVNPPQPGDPSYEIFIQEKTAVLKSLKERAKLVADTFNSIEGMKCNEVRGAMYAFPQLILPQKAIDKAKELGQAPDAFYAMELLENTGICIVPGSGFGQKPGTHHFRTTILPQPEKLMQMMNNIKDFHMKFLEKYQ